MLKDIVFLVGKREENTHEYSKKQRNTGVKIYNIYQGMYVIALFGENYMKIYTHKTRTLW